MIDRVSRKKLAISKRQAQILRAAMNVFVRKGYTAATIPEIAKSCGLAVGTIYIYFPNKHELFISVVKSLIVAPVIGIFENKLSQDFPTMLKDTIENRIGFLQGRSLNSVLALMGEIQRDDALRAMFAEKVIKPFLGRMENIYRARIDSGEFRKMEPEIVVRLIGSMIIGMSMLEKTEGETSPLNRISQEKLGDEIINFILHGLLKPATKS
jgi:AcrR family transcriptional regulator